MSDERPGLALPPGQLPPIRIDPDAVTLSEGMTTSIGKKYIMAWCGIFWCLFLIVHLIGNLTIFVGADTFNSYAHKLESLGPFLIIAEIGLVAFLLAHVFFGIAVTLGNWAARPVKYKVDRKKGGRNAASSTMIWTGALIMVFVVIHLINLKFGTHHEVDGKKDLFTTTVALFRDPVYLIGYVAAVALVGVHTAHAVQSGFRTIGVHNDKYTPKITAFSWTFGVLMFLGYASIPILANLGHGEAMSLQSNVPDGPIQTKWDDYRFELKLVNPANKRKYSVIVVGTGLAGASAAASMGEMGYHVKAFTLLDSARRAHSIAAQGGINAAKNYPNDGDSIYRLFYDTVKGGDFRAREANVYRLAQVSNNIIDQCVAQGVPFAREYGGYLANRSFGGAQVSRTFYARGQTGQQLLLGAYSALMRQVQAGSVTLYPRVEMLDLIVVDGVARGIITRNLVSGAIEAHTADAVVLATGGYGRVYHLSTNALGCNITAAWRAAKKGAYFANPSFVQIHPTCIPVGAHRQSKLTLMSESLRNDGRVWVPMKEGDNRPPSQIPEDERDYYLERRYPAFGNLVPRDVASRAAKIVCDEGKGIGDTGLAVYLDFEDAINRLGKKAISDKYGNLFDMYQMITDENPYQVPMRIFPAIHYSMGGLWVDYNLMSNLPGLFVIGEANFSDHGANRLGASALMQGLADGYFVLPYTIGGYLAGTKPGEVGEDHSACGDAVKETQAQTDKLLSLEGGKTCDELHKELGLLMWETCGMSRNADGLKEAAEKIPEIRERFWKEATVPGTGKDLNQSLELAARVADFMEFAEFMAIDGLERDESCGCHLREEHQTEDGEAKRNDKDFSYVAAWEFNGVGEKPTLHKEELTFEYVKPSTRSYK